MERNYRKVLMDCVSTVTDYDGGMESHSVTDIHDEINQVYHESLLFKEIVRIMNNDFKSWEERVSEVNEITLEYQNNLFNQL